MLSSLFISYCRREAPFVDSFLKELEKRDFKVWLDYHTLIPGKPWQKQIYEGLKGAETFLLVVSQESIASKNVKWEWEQAIALNKRIILIIFEAVKLPPELQHYEWIDLRGSFKSGIKNLIQQLKAPIPLKSAPPEEGFKAPLMVGVTIGISTIVSFLSLFTIWTIYIPYYLFPLPYRIIKRDFNFFHVRSALLMLPFASVLSYILFLAWTDEWEAPADFNVNEWGLRLFLPPLLLLLLYSPSMQRWGKPIASRPKFANPYNPQIRHPKPISFTVDFAKEDKNYADAIIHCLTRYGHLYVEKHMAEEKTVEAVLVLISAFKDTTVFSPEEYVVYPILLQDTKTVAPVLQYIQWIDFRCGLKNLDKLAQLLPEPTRLLKALGIVPASNQTVLSPIIQVILLYLMILALMIIGSWIIIFLTFRQSFSFTEFFLISLTLATALKITNSAIQSLTSRKGFWASMASLIGVLVLLGLILRVPMIFVSEFREGSGAGVAVYAYVLMAYWLGLFLVVPLGIWNFRVLKRWFPYR